MYMYIYIILTLSQLTEGSVDLWSLYMGGGIPLLALAFDVQGIKTTQILSQALVLPIVWVRHLREEGVPFANCVDFNEIRDFTETLHWTAFYQLRVCVWMWMCASDDVIFVSSAWVRKWGNLWKTCPFSFCTVASRSFSVVRSLVCEGLFDPTSISILVAHRHKII